MASLNKCLFIGNAGANPEVRTFENGNKIATLRLAVSERYTDRNGQTQDLTEWIPVVFNGKLADIAAQYIVKGSPVYVEGKWRTRKWTDQQGADHYQTELRVDVLQLLGQRQQQAQAQPQQQQYQQRPQQQAPQYQQPAPAQPVYPQYAPQPQSAPAPAPAPAPQADIPFDDMPF